MEPKFWMVFVTAIIPLIVGSIYYNPKTVGNIWMKEAGLTQEQEQSGNMLKIFGFTYLLGVLLSTAIMFMVVHQTGIFGAFEGTDFMTEGTANHKLYKDVMSAVGNNHRNLKHGMIHGIMGGLFFAWPVISINAMFERRGWKYVAIHLGYWVITCALIGAVLCAYV